MKLIYGVIPILVILSVIIASNPFEIQAAEKKDTIIPEETAFKIIIKDQDGALVFDKELGEIEIHEKDRTDDFSKIIDYEIESYLLIDSKWVRMNINDALCSTFEQAYHIEDVMTLECLKQDLFGFLLLQYQVSDTGILASGLYQSSDKTRDNTNYFKLVEKIKGDVTLFDDRDKTMKLKNIDFTSKSKLRLLQETDSTFIDGNSLDTSFETVEKLRYGYAVSFERNFDY